MPNPRVILAAAACVVAAACASASVRSSTNRDDPAAAPDLERFRTATTPYQTLDSAVTAGYPREVAACIVGNGNVAMGYHHMKASFVDGKLSPERPQMLLYERLANGKYQLNGAEFIIPYRFWPRDSVAPVFMGQKLMREDNFKYWYLHVWAWKNNPLGMFAPFNPDVHCDSGSAKLYVPNPMP